jgi:adenosylcobinamide-phosphate synthase
VTVLLLALLLDLALGEPPNRWHPVAWVGGLLAWGRRRRWAATPAGLLAGGALVLGAVLALVVVTALGTAWLASRLGALGVLLEALALKPAFAFRRLLGAAREVERHLALGRLEPARSAVGRHLVSRPTASLSDAHVASAAVESVAENLTDSLLAPLLFYLVAGLPGAWAYRVVNTADAMWGYREGELEHLGKAAARLDDLLNWLPARLAGLLVVLGAALVGESPRRAWRAMRRDHGRTASPNAGWTMAAMAGALGVTLEKPGAYRLGEGPLPTASTIGPAVRVALAAALLATAVCLGLAALAR